MHVVHLISNLNFGGAETSLCALVEAENAAGAARHTVISLLDRGALRPRLEAAGATVIELGGQRGPGGILLFRKVKQVIRETRPDVLQCWMYHANLAAGIVQMTGGTGCPVIWGVRQGAATIRYERRTTRAIMLACSPLSRLPKRIVYNSGHAALEHERLGYSRSRRAVISNGIDCVRFRPRPEAASVLRAKLNISAEDPIIGRVARVVPMKDYPTLFAAFSLVLEQHPQAHLVVVGPKSKQETDTLKQLAGQRSAAQRLHILPLDANVEQLYPAFDVLVSSSSANEGFPNTVGEAMACGVPSVATRVGEASLLKGCHACVEPKNPTALAEAITGFLALPEQERRAARAAARAFMQECHSLAANRQAFSDLWADTAMSRG